MATLAEKLLEHGIRPNSYAEGDQKLLCPKCSHTRRPEHRREPCLSLTIEAEGAVWKCHNCNWADGVTTRSPNHARASRGSFRTPPVRPKVPPSDPTAAVMQWLANRGISE